MNPIRSESLTIFFPVHNEVDNLEPLVREANSVISDLTSDPEIIIVNDGSTDGTSRVADELARELECVRVIHHSQNQGYGGALQSGFRGASKDLVFYTDGDGQFDIQELRKIIHFADSSDVVTCFRQDRQDPWHRKINTKLFEFAVRVWFGLRVRDPDCAFKIYRREVIERIVMQCTGALIDVEMLVQSQREGFKIVQTGVSHLPRRAGKASGADPKVIFKAINEIIKLWLRLGSRFCPKKPAL